MGLAPLNTPAQHNSNKRRTISPQASLCATLPQSPTRVSPLRGIVCPSATQVEESSSPSPRRRSSGLLSYNSTDAVVEDVVAGDALESPLPPTPALYYEGGIVTQPRAGPDMLSLGLALQQQASGISRSSAGTDEEAVTDEALSQHSAEKAPRFLYGRVLLGIGSLLVAGGMALLISANSKRASIGSKEKQ
ncbi:unnamed protein product [Ostreobium quekettii]|uniref:Transmembrane protein n=1 Tax=Ostreobium quekettii TaxID=121088 RepID=A0A8S1J9U1_9CHLO|nr:unnamed protein product [Ostreobium quekettii]|eukprot:evm.model.scf_860.2 EVM.evm.TU.scf_860.2   scf_860:12913-14635(-)